MTRRTLRRVLAALLIIVVGGLGYKLIGQDLKQRFFVPKQKQESYAYQKTLESQLEEKIGGILKQVYGKNAYYVSVVVKLHNKEEHTEIKRVLPKTVSANFVERTTYEATTSKNELATFEGKNHADTPKKGAPTEDPLTVSELMPGLIPEVASNANYRKPLPGFPVIETRNFVEKKQPQTVTDLEEEDELDSTMDQEGALELEKNILTNEKRDDHVFYDEILAETNTPNTVIDRLFVSVVVDKVQFEGRGVSENVLRQLIENMAGIHPERGDQVVISVMPMRQAWVNVMSSYHEYKPLLDKLVAFLAKFKLLFYGALLVLAGWFLNKFVRKEMLRREEKKKAEQLASLKKKAEEAANEKQELKSEDEAREIAILALAKEKPADFAKLLLNWAEKE